MGDYDITLKTLFEGGGRRFLANLDVRGEFVQLNVELPNISERRVDMLARTDESWVHIEFQSAQVSDMAIRMLEYRVALMRRLHKFNKGRRRYRIRAIA